MRNVFGKITIRTKILILVVLPLAALIFVAAIDIQKLNHSVERQIQLSAYTETAVVTSNLLHVLQKERGMSSGYISSAGASFGDSLVESRADTDMHIGKFRNAVQNHGYGEEFEAAIADIKATLDALSSMRDKVLDRSISGADAVAYYTHLNEQLIGSIRQGFPIANNPEALRDLSAFYFFLDAKDWAGRERAIGAMGFAKGWDQAARIKLSSTVEHQNSGYQAFMAVARPQAREIFNQTSNMPIFAEIKQYEDAILSETPLDGITSKIWFEKSTMMIDALKEVETEVADRIIADASAATTAAREYRTFVFTALAILLTILGAVSWLIIADIVRAIRRLNRAMRALADDELDISIPGTHRQDEIGGMARVVGHFQEAAIAKRQADAVLEEARLEQEQVVSVLANGLRKLKEGNLAHHIHSDFPPAYEELKTNFNNTVSALAQTMTGVTEAARSIRSGAGELNIAADDLSKRTEKQSSNLSEASSTIEKVTSNVRETAQASQIANQSVKDAEAESTKCIEVISNTSSAMGRIEEGSKQISQIIGFIDNIAFQTNLLALNAGVEAARAGESGRGFAVVANEVRALAQRSADAASDIKRLIDQNSDEVSNGVQLVEQSSAALERIAGQVADISAHIDAISTSAAQQAESLGEVNGGMNDLDIITQQNASMVEEASAAVRSLDTQTEMLRDQMAKFMLTDENEKAKAKQKASPPPVRLAS